MSCRNAACECPQCSGDVAKGTPAVQALAWAVAEAREHRGLSRFWQGALAAETFQLSIESSTSDESQRVTEWVDSTMARAQASAGLLDTEYWGTSLRFESRGALQTIAPNIAAAGPGSESAAIDLADLLDHVFTQLAGDDGPDADENGGEPAAPPVQPPCEVTEEGRPTIDPYAEGNCVLYWPDEDTLLAGAGGAKVCCVQEFSYPKSLKRFFRQTQPGGEQREYGNGAAVGFCFTATAQFKENDECACECCLFMQSIAVTGKWGRSEVFQSEFQEDYILWKDATGTHRHSFGRRTQTDPKSQLAEEVVGGVGSDKAHKYEQKRPRFIDGRDNYSADAGNRQGSQSSGCYYYMKDCPTFYVQPGDSFNMTYRYKGAIWDICVFAIAEGPKYFTVNLSGAYRWGMLRATYDVRRSDENGEPGEQLASGDIYGNPYVSDGPEGPFPPSEYRWGSDY